MKIIRIVENVVIRKDVVCLNLFIGIYVPSTIYMLVNMIIYEYILKFCIKSNIIYKSDSL